MQKGNDIMATGNTIITNAKKYVGRPYVWGGESMSEGGYDCSGFVYCVLRDSGYNVARSTAQGYSALGTEVSYSNARIGDLIFFGTSRSHITHIAIYAGNGKMYESIGSSKNNKNNPGRGVSLTNVSRRSDRVLVKRVASSVASNTQPSNSTQNTISSSQSWKGNTNYYLDNGYVSGWQKAMNKGFDTNELSADGKFGNASQQFAKTHLLWSGQKHNCITAINWLRTILHDTYGFSKLSKTGQWNDYLTKCVKVFQENRGIKADGIVGLETTYHLLTGISK